MTVTLKNSIGCDLGSWDQVVVGEDFTNALIECLIKNHIVLCDGDSLVIE